MKILFRKAFIRLRPFVPSFTLKFFCSQHVHFAVPPSISKYFQKKSKFQLPYLLDRQTKAQRDKNDSFSLALQVSCKIRSRTRDMWLPISIFIKHPSMPCVALCYSLWLSLATFKREVEVLGGFVGFGVCFFFRYSYGHVSLSNTVEYAGVPETMLCHIDPSEY